MTHSELEALAIQYAEQASGKRDGMRGPMYGQVNATLATAYATLALAAAIRDSEPAS